MESKVRFLRGSSCDPKHMNHQAEFTRTSGWPVSPEQAGPCVQQERFSIVVDADPELALSSGSIVFFWEKNMGSDALQ